MFFISLTLHIDGNSGGGIYAWQFLLNPKYPKQLKISNALIKSEVCTWNTKAKYE